MQDIREQNRPNECCPECGNTKLVETIREQQFTYGTQENAVMLTASMPVISCEDCHYEYFDERGEVARHVAVCRHLGLQTPEEIREVRNATGMSRTAFCDLTGFGTASLQRWEAGMVVPNASSDRLIFLLRFKENIERLEKRNNAYLKKDATADPSHVFRVEPLRETTPVVHTRCATKRFTRLSSRSRVTAQAATWNLRAR
jgi:putative zinc finger/helix-turn-helix YgiT family protein